MNNESYISTLETEAEHEICELPGATVSRPCEVAKLRLPIDARSFDDEEFRKSFSASYLLGFLPMQLRAMRKSEELSQKDLAERMDTRQNAISRLEKVDNRGLNIGTAIKIGEALDRPFIAYWGTYSELLAQVARTEEDPQAFLLTPAYRDDPGFHPGKPPLPSSDSDQLRGIQKALFLWLDRAAPDPAALARFVQGYDLPPLSDALPPYQWVFQAIREWDLKGGARNKLFSGIVGCLEHLGALFRREDETGWESWAEPLFLLCSLLEDAPQLGRPLFHLFELFERAVKRGERRLTLEVRSAFTSALLENGPAEKLLPVVNKIKDDPQSDPFLFASAEELKGAFTRMGRYLMQNPGKSAEQGALRIWGLQFDTQRPEEFKRKALVILNETLPEGWRRSELLFHAGCVIVYGAYLESRWNDLKFTRWIFQALAAELNPQPEDVDGRPEAKLVAKIVSFLPSASTPAIDLEAHFLSSVQSV